MRARDKSKRENREREGHGTGRHDRSIPGRCPVSNRHIMGVLSQRPSKGANRSPEIDFMLESDRNGSVEWSKGWGWSGILGYFSMVVFFFWRGGGCM